MKQQCTCSWCKARAQADIYREFSLIVANPLNGRTTQTAQAQQPEAETEPTLQDMLTEWWNLKRRELPFA